MQSHAITDLQRRSKEDVPPASKGDDLILQVIQLGRERERSDDIRTEANALHDRHTRVLVDEADHRDEHAAAHAYLQPAQVDEHEGSHDHKVLNEVHLLSERESMSQSSIRVRVSQ